MPEKKYTEKRLIRYAVYLVISIAVLILIYTWSGLGKENKSEEKPTQKPETYLNFTSSDKDTSNLLIIRINKEGTFLLQDKPIEPHLLRSVLKEKSDSGTKPKIRVYVHPDSPSMYLAQALKMIQEEGLEIEKIIKSQ